MATCFEELSELARHGIDEGIIRGFGGVIYRECHPRGHGKISLKKFVVCLGGEESVSGTRRPQAPF